MEALCRNSSVRKVIKYKRKVTTSEKNKDTTVEKKKIPEIISELLSQGKRGW